MPKIEVNEKLFFSLVGKKYSYNELEEKLTSAKAELDEAPDESKNENERTIKIELNDTNRPDLWSTAGLARQLALYAGKKHSDLYKNFFSTATKKQACKNRVVKVDSEIKNVRPYIVAFVMSGKKIDDALLKDIIQTQEKLAWNFGRKRKTISMGVYRVNEIQFPVSYKAVDPDATSFVPLGFENKMTCREIVAEHPKGKDYGWILNGMKKFPLLVDAKNEVLSMAPIINSATLGAVQVGDSDLMVELTGTDLESLMLSANIVACDFSDYGFSIEPIACEYPYETIFGKTVVAPFYFQKATKAKQSAINKLLGSHFDEKEILASLYRMGNVAHAVTVHSNKDDDIEFEVFPPPYRNDFLHEADIIEEVMIGAGLENFTPESPRDFTIGRLLPVTILSRKIKMLMAGLGYQEMIFNYLGSKKDYIDSMRSDGKNVIEIANPMSENYEFVRPEIISSLLRAEGKSANALFPHKIFEVGKIAVIDESENTGTSTQQHLGFLVAEAGANFNKAASDVSSLLYFLACAYEVRESHDERFIEGRQAEVVSNGKLLGVFGEVHPEILENWSITVPCFAGELNVDAIASL